MKVLHADARYTPPRSDHVEGKLPGIGVPKSFVSEPVFHRKTGFNSPDTLNHNISASTFRCILDDLHHVVGLLDGFGP